MISIKKVLTTTMVLSTACSLVACGKTDSPSPNVSISTPSSVNNSGNIIPSLEMKSDSVKISEITNAITEKYGKIDDMVLQMEVVLPNGDIILTSPTPKHAVGPDLNQIFISKLLKKLRCDFMVGSHNITPFQN